jgi:hypothetical protein
MMLADIDKDDEAFQGCRSYSWQAAGMHEAAKPYPSMQCTAAASSPIAEPPLAIVEVTAARATQLPRSQYTT